MSNEAMTVKKMLPNLPLSIEQRLEGLTRILEKKSTRLGRELSNYMERRHFTKSVEAQAQVALDAMWPINTSKDGSLTTGMEEGYPISVDQMIEHQIYSEIYPQVDFYFLTKVRTFSFACREFDEVLAIFAAAKSLGVCMTPTQMYLSCLDYKKPSAYGLHKVEFITTSRMSMIIKVMRHAKSDGYLMLRECALEENKLEDTYRIAEQIGEVEQREIEWHLKCLF
jgi:hypothetical protein